MARKGGYKIIDFKDKNLTSSPTIDGIYDSIENNYRKPLLLSGLVIGGVEKASVFAIATLSSTSFVFSNIYGYNITITDEDGVSITAVS